MKKITLLLLLIPVSAVAAETSDEDLWDFLPEPMPTSEIGISGSLDSVDGSSLQLSGSFQAPASSRISLSLGKSRSVSDFSTLDTTFWRVGWRSDPAAVAGVTLAYEGEDNDGAFDSSGVSLGLAFNSDSMTLSITPRFRNISMDVRQRKANRPGTIDLDARDLTVAVEWFSESGWVIGGRHTVSDYSRDLRRLATDPKIQLLFSPETLELSSGLEERRTSLSIFRSLASALVGIEWSRGLSEATDSVSTTVSMLASFDISPQWRLDLGVGATNADYNSETTFSGNAGVTYRW